MAEKKISKGKTMAMLIYPVKTDKEDVYIFKKQIMDYETAVKTAKEVKI
ncbi:MAG: hypothetical protein II393_01285 [Cytophagales bacterium]|nr:hypothetical protein [Cytophagales bacterium]